MLPQSHSSFVQRGAERGACACAGAKRKSGCCCKTLHAQASLPIQRKAQAALFAAYHSYPSCQDLSCCQSRTLQTLCYLTCTAYSLVPVAPLSTRFSNSRLGGSDCNRHYTFGIRGLLVAPNQAQPVVHIKDLSELRSWRET